MNRKEYKMPNDRTAVFEYDDNGVGRISLEALDILMENYERNCWIPVTERLPEIGGTYIVSGRMKYDHDKQYDYFVDAAAYDPVDGWDTFHDNWEGQQDFAIIAWMQLPEPYREDER